MSKKAITRKDWIKTREELAAQVNAILKERKLSVAEVSEQSGIPLYVMDNITLARNYCLLDNLRHLAKFLNKRLRIELIDRD